MDINGWYNSPGGVYYVRQFGDSVWWFGESHQGSLVEGRAFANVFIGRRSGNELTGEWFDVPKGRSENRGTLTMAISDGNERINLVSETGGFGDGGWTREGRNHLFLPRIAWSTHNAGFHTTVPDDYTGTWLSDDGAMYYVRQVGDKVVWVGEGRFGHAHVFYGTVEGSRITGIWLDVPKADDSSMGAIVLARHTAIELTGETSDPQVGLLAKSPYLLVVEGDPGGFRSKELFKIDTAGIEISFNALELVRLEDGEGDEPYLWTFFWKADGDTVDAVRLNQATVTIVSRSGSQGNLHNGEDLPRDTVLPILDPRVGRFSTVLKTIKNLDPCADLTKRFTFLGTAVAAFDEDAGSNDFMEGLRQVVLTEAQATANRAIRGIRTSRAGIAELKATLEANITTAINVAVRAIIFPGLGGGGIPIGFLDPDDQIGRGSAEFTFYDLIAGSSPFTELPAKHITMDLTRTGPLYRLTGEVKVHYTGFASIPALCVAANQDGRLEAFFTKDAHMFHHWQEAEGSWAGQRPFGKESDRAKKIAVANNQDGRLEVVYIGTNDRLYHNWQSAANQEWNGEEMLGASGDMARELAMCLRSDGRLDVVYVGMDRKVYRNVQTEPNAGWSGRVAVPIAGSVKTIAIGRNQTGGTQVFYTGSDNTLHHISEGEALGSWGAEQLFRDATVKAKRIFMFQTGYGYLQLFFIDEQDRIRTSRQIQSGSWLGIRAVEGLTTAARSLSIAQHADNRIELIVIDENKRIHASTRSLDDTAWTSVTLVERTNPAIAAEVRLNKHGRLEIVYMGTDGKLYYVRQRAQNGTWNEVEYGVMEAPEA